MPKYAGDMLIITVSEQDGDTEGGRLTLGVA